MASEWEQLVEECGPPVSLHLMWDAVYLEWDDGLPYIGMGNLQAGNPKPRFMRIGQEVLVELSGPDSLSGKWPGNTITIPASTVLNVSDYFFNLRHLHGSTLEVVMEEGKEYGTSFI